MTALYLKTSTEEEMISALTSAGLLSTDPLDPQLQFIRQDEVATVVVLGVLSKPTGAVISDPEVGDYEECEALPGFHVNVLTSDDGIIDALAQIRIFPNTPLVKWAGIE
ncbi:hypothetical protein ACEK07_22975 [Alcanivoracaceae bacterium MT1]